jgi:hypothetical protein
MGIRAICAVLALAVAAAACRDDATHWDFEEGTIGQLLQGWKTAKTGDGEGSVWKIVEDAIAPKGPKVLAQQAESPLALFNLCVADSLRASDGDTVLFQTAQKKPTREAGFKKLSSLHSTISGEEEIRTLDTV